MAKIQVRYGGAQGERLALRVSDELVAVRTKGGRRLRDTDISTDARAMLGEFDSVFRIPQFGIEVLRCTNPKGKRSRRDAARRVLKSEGRVRFAGRVLETKAGSPVLYTENLFVQFHEDVSRKKARALFKKLGLQEKRELSYAPNAWFVGAHEGTGLATFEIAEQLLGRDDVLLCHPELVREVHSKAAFRQQWHLKTTRIDGRSINEHAHVESAWSLSEGEGVTIAVIDDGVDLVHEEFRGAAKIVAPRDVTRRNDDPTPGPGDQHGTACAGVAVANGNVGASGVAPKANLMPIRLASFLGSQAEADAFVWAADRGADVISCSWGPPDGRWWDPNDPTHDQYVPLPDSTRLAIDYAIREGRSGKGCVITWAAGNGNESVDNDGYASYERVIAVGASNDRGGRSAYSDQGGALWCCFPSSDGNPSLTPGIWTTDNSGRSGYNAGNADDGDSQGNYTNSFGGTSSACPGVAGVVALVLARNPDLTWQQVKDVLRRSADKIGSGYDEEGHSPDFGFGRVNARKAVELAEPAPAEGARYNAYHRTTKSVEIRDQKTAKIPVQVADTDPIRNVRVHLDLEHTWVGDLVVRLKAPNGLGIGAIKMHDREGGNQRNLRKTYDVASTPQLDQLVGSSPAGKWVVEVSDRATRDEGRIVSTAVEFDF